MSVASTSRAVTQIPYAIILVVASIGLTIRHCRSASISDRSRWILAGCTISAVAATPFLPMIAALMQLGICLYILIDRMVQSEAAREPHDERRP